MQQIKIFKGVESTYDELEDQVNQWLKESGVRVVNIFGNISPQTPGISQTTHSGSRQYGPSDIMLVVVYESSSGGG